MHCYISSLVLIYTVLSCGSPSPLSFVRDALPADEASSDEIGGRAPWATMARATGSGTNGKADNCRSSWDVKCGVQLTKGWYNPVTMIEVLVNDRLGKRIRVKCLEEDLVGDFKKIVALQLGSQPAKIVLQKGNNVLKDHISLGDYEVHDGTNLELYYS